MPKFYEGADVFVNATRCEGFGLTGLEAQAMGLPSIQTAFGGQVDYMGEWDFYIDYVLSTVKHDMSYEGIRWATPDVSQLRKYMRFCYENPDIIKQASKLARENALKWSWRSTAKKAITALKKL